jgi:hypothetical protein
MQAFQDSTGLRSLRPGWGELFRLAGISSMAWTGGRRWLAALSYPGQLLVLALYQVQGALYREVTHRRALLVVDRLPRTSATSNRGAGVLLSVVDVAAAAYLVVAYPGMATTVGVGILAWVSAGLVVMLVQAGPADPSGGGALRAARSRRPRPYLLGLAAAWPSRQGHLTLLVSELLNERQIGDLYVKARTPELAHVYSRWGFNPIESGSRILSRWVP